MTFKSALFGAALACGLAASSMAAAATISIKTTPSQVAAMTGLTGATLDFEGIARGVHSQVGGAGVTITSDSGQMVVENEYAGEFNTFGNALTDQRWAFEELYFDFDAAVEGFGFFYGASDYGWELTAYDAAGGVLETLLLPVLGESNDGDFFGIKASGIARASLRTARPGDIKDYIFVDNFTLGAASPVSAVPEPAAWAMMIVGFGLSGAALRRPRRIAGPPQQALAS